ncbi:MAG: hypothetical protein ACK559_41680, partial [bacterium]
RVAKCHDHVVEYFSQVFVLILSVWKFGFIIFLSVIQRIIIFSKSNSAHHYFSSSKCKQALIFISKCKPALIFCSSRYETVSNCCSKQFHISLLSPGLFDYVSNAIF